MSPLRRPDCKGYFCHLFWGAGEPWTPNKIGDKFLLCGGRAVDEIFVTYFGGPWTRLSARTQPRELGSGRLLAETASFFKPEGNPATGGPGRPPEDVFGPKAAHTAPIWTAPGRDSVIFRAGRESGNERSPEAVREENKKRNPQSANPPNRPNRMCDAPNPMQLMACLCIIDKIYTVHA